jgi:hypothetical protein
MTATPTYRIQTMPDGTTIYHCLYCEQAGSGHWARDWTLFTFHMQQRHDGQLIEATDSAAAPETPAPESSVPSTPVPPTPDPQSPEPEPPPPDAPEE